MQAARRLYLYVMSGITLSVVAFGLVLLARVALRDVFPAPGFDEFSYDPSREQLSQAIAMLGVGTPVWAIHWWLVQRGLRPSNPGHEAERGSALRAAYFTLVLLVSLLIWVTSAITVIGWLLVGLLDARPEYDYADPLSPATLAVVAFVVWLFHGLVRRGDLATGNVEGAAAWLPRLYLYGVAIGALFTALGSIGSVVSSLVFADWAAEDTYRVTYLVDRGLTALGWGLVWFGHWFYARNLALRPEGRGADERISRTRVAAFVVVIVGAAAIALQALAGVIEDVIRPVLVPNADDVFGTPWAPAILTSAMGVVLYGVTSFLHARALDREPAAADRLRALHQARLTGHGLAAAMLLMGGAGAAWVAGYVIELAFAGQRLGSGFDSDAYQLPMWLSMAVVGLGAWFITWRGVMARRRRDALGEATSTIRRTFLYLTLGAALVAVLGTGTLILYRLTGILLGAGVSGSLARELSTPLGVLLVALLVIAYHGLQLRGDMRLAAAEAPEAAEPPIGEPAPATTSVTLTLKVPAGTDPAPTIAGLQAALPPGAELSTKDG